MARSSLFWLYDILKVLSVFCHCNDAAFLLEGQSVCTVTLHCNCKGSRTESHTGYGGLLSTESELDMTEKTGTS